MQKALLSDLKILFTVIVISIILILLDSIRFLDLPKTGLQFITSPIQYGLYKTSRSVGSQFEVIAISRRASQENKALREQLATILSENSKLQKKVDETAAFLEQQNSLDAESFNLVATRPVGFSRYLFIDKGSSDNLKVGQVVIYKDTFIGKIIEVTPKKSKVILPSDPDLQIAAFVNNSQGRARGILAGQFGQEMLLGKVLHEEPLSPNDLVYTEGTEIEIPRGLVLGSVTEVIDLDNQVFKQAKVRPIFQIEDLDVVFVITE